MNNGFGEPTVVTAGDISRNFGQWQDRALSGPVVVTHHGRPRVVLVSADVYSSWSTVAPAESSDGAFEASRAAILDHMAEAFMALDERLRITAVNHAFKALTGLSAAQMIGRSWEDLFPPFTQVVLGERLKQVLASGEAQDFEVAGDGLGRRRYAVHAFPHPGGVAVLVQNRTAEQDLRVQAHDAKALEEALGALSQVMVLRMNIRGLLTDVGKPFAQLVGFSEEELGARRLWDLVRPSEQQALAAALESVMESARAAQLTATLMTKDGGELPVKIGASAVVDDLTAQGLVATVAIA